MDREGVGKRLVERVGQMRADVARRRPASTASDAEDTVDVGGQLRYFGDGYQASKVLDGQRYWRVPVMEGEFLVQERFGVVKGVAGGNLIMLGRDARVGAARGRGRGERDARGRGRDHAVPGRDRAQRQQGRLALQRAAGRRPTTRCARRCAAQVEHTDVPPDVEAVFEIVIDGLALEPVREAMRVGLLAAAEAGASHVTAGNYGGNLGPHHIHLPRADAMTLTLTLREQPVVPLEAEVLAPDRLAGASRAEIEALPVWHGNERARVGDFFAVSGAGDDVRLEGDLRRVQYVGAGMTAGRLTVAGDVGMHAGAGMRGGELHVEGDAGDWAGAGMRGGTLVVRGSAGRRLGGVRSGERAGMRGGEIVVHGDAGEQAGAGLRRGLIAVAGRAGEAAGLRMLAGTIVALGGLGPRAGAGMRRGSIVTMAPADAARDLRVLRASTARRSCACTCAGCARSACAVSDEQLDGRYARWCGDGARAAARRDPDPGGGRMTPRRSTSARAGARRPAGRRRRGAAGRGHDARQRHAGDRLRRAGGFEAGRVLRRDLHGGARERRLRAAGRSRAAGCPALTVTTDRPAVACLAAQYAGWRIDRDGYFAMGSGPGRALIRAEELYDDLGWDEQASAAVLCLETREAPPAEVADFVADRAGVPPDAR